MMELLPSHAFSTLVRDDGWCQRTNPDQQLYNYVPMDNLTLMVNVYSFKMSVHFFFTLDLFNIILHLLSMCISYTNMTSGVNNYLHWILLQCNHSFNLFHTFNYIHVKLITDVFFIKYHRGQDEAHMSSAGLQMCEVR